MSSKRRFALLMFIACFFLLTRDVLSQAPVRVSAAESSKLLTIQHAMAARQYLMMHFHFVIKLEYVVTAEGRITNVTDVTPDSPHDPKRDPRSKVAEDCGQYITEAWRYRPYTLGGTPTAMRTSVQFVFDPSTPTEYPKILYH